MNSINPAIMAAILCALCFAGSMMATKKLTIDQSISCILFWLTAMQLFMGACFAGYDGYVTVPNKIQLMWVTAVGICGVTAHFCITKALSRAPAIIVVPMDFLRLPLIAVIGLFYYGETLEWPIMVGAVIILAANVINLLEKQSNT